MPTKKNILVTSALPYANGALHLGHMLEFIQTDIWVRFNKMLGHNCTFIGADDAHGTAIMLKATSLGITPEQLIEQTNREHQQDLADFLIDVDYYGSTHCPENQELSSKIYQSLEEKGYIEQRDIVQLFDEEKQIFLADRFVKGECPKCHASDQYGDNCEACGSTYNAMELLNPCSKLSESTPIKKQSKHYFLQLGKFHDLLKEWLASGSLQPEVVNKLQEWIKAGLQDWDISRDAPYFGFTIPGETSKYFYVWLDAPVGYVAALANLAQTRDDIKFDDYWQPDNNTELYHFIGKDILYFHGLFWPAMLHGSGYRLPTGIFAHGFVTVNGAKMSKSRGTFINARSYLEHLEPQYLRYYFASKLTSGLQDIDINFADFTAKINSELVGKIVNIASRSCKFIEQHFDNLLGNSYDEALLTTAMAAGDKIAEHYQAREYSKAMRAIVELADITNKYIDERKPWVLAKDPAKLAQVELVCSSAINVFRIIVVYLQPVLPHLAQAVSALLNTPMSTWDESKQILTNHKINKFTPLLARIDAKVVESLYSL
jgi:methionyl-tRNA synthetase